MDIIEKLKIAEENYEGYAELFKLGYVNEEQQKLQKKYLISSFAGLTLAIPSFIFPAHFGVFLALLFAYETITATYLFRTNTKIRKKRKQELKEKYPYVNLDTDETELRQVLQECGILTTKLVDGYECWNIDLENYRRNLLSLKMLKGSDMELPKCMKENISKRLDKSKSEQVMDNFMQKLGDDHFDRSEPQVGDDFNPTPEFIEQTISNYQKLLELRLIPPFEEENVSEEKGQVLQKIRKENK